MFYCKLWDGCVIFKSIVILRITLFILGAIAISGSFYTSYLGNTPCPYCMTLRYLALVFTLVSLVYLVSPKKLLLYLLLILSLSGDVVGGVLLKKDLNTLHTFSAQAESAPLIEDGGLGDLGLDEEGFCAPGVVCESPIIYGYPASAYALGLFSVMTFFSLVALFVGFKKK